jgi:hypothetical protein
MQLLKNVVGMVSENTRDVRACNIICQQVANNIRAGILAETEMLKFLLTI